MKIGIVFYNMGNLQSVINAFQKVAKEFKREVKVEIVTEGERLGEYDRLFLPGVGAFGDAIAHLNEHNLIEGLQKFAHSGRPLLGVCLGMQLLFEKSYEFGEHKGLGLIPGKVVRFNKSAMGKVKKGLNSEGIFLKTDIEKKASNKTVNKELDSKKSNLKKLGPEKLEKKRETIYNQSLNYKIPHMGWNRLFPKIDRYGKVPPIFKGLEYGPYLYFVHSYHGITDAQFVAGWTYYGYRFLSAIWKDNIYGLQPHPEKSHSAGLQILYNFLTLP